jgi:hypothetical protein
MNRSDIPGQTAADGCPPARARTIPPLIAFGIIYVAAIAALRLIEMPRAAQIPVALAPLPVFAFYLVRWIRAMRQLDELQRLIQLEALAIAFPLALLVILALGLLQMIEALPMRLADYLRLWPVVFWLYFLGLFIARKRYR